ncbi:hypothetical protein SADUNF_Sadunf16G0154000 [Salix dunnii]|uniref:Uncharacterized protein n=1 Tax=Salix dunnii TaxID=1413687 RepID=A0A835J8Z7_9ROSI|nr:hypothetical protein SADUNF_Sadunf16G0154000 [Salix dunnii]
MEQIHAPLKSKPRSVKGLLALSPPHQGIDGDRVECERSGDDHSTEHIWRRRCGQEYGERTVDMESDNGGYGACVFSSIQAHEEREGSVVVGPINTCQLVFRTRLEYSQAAID